VLILAFVGVVTAMAFSLAPAALSMNKVFYHSGSDADMALEQVPLAFLSMVSLFALIGFLAAYCYIIMLSQSSGTAPLAVILAGCGLLAAAAIAVTGFLLKRNYSL
jgi:ABC-type Fe3+-siderophore transport system permease subunit